MISIKQRDRGEEADFEIHRGNGWYQVFSIHKKNTGAVDILDWIPKIKVWDSPPLDQGIPNDLLYEFSLENDRMKIESAADGVFAATLSAEETKDLPFQVGFYKLEAKPPWRDPIHYASGLLKVK